MEKSALTFVAVWFFGPPDYISFLCPDRFLPVPTVDFCRPGRRWNIFDFMVVLLSAAGHGPEHWTLLLSGCHVEQWRTGFIAVDEWSRDTGTSWNLHVTEAASVIHGLPIPEADVSACH